MTIPIGIQLFSVRSALAADPEGTLHALAELGFTRIEGANHDASDDDGIGFGIASERLAKVLHATGLGLVGCHINPLSLERLPAVLDFHASLGNPGIGCDIEFYPVGDLDYVKRRADTFNRVGELCAQRGMQFYYHNHFQEFQEIDGTTIYELIAENTDPELVALEMDTYWMYRGGQDPLDWIARYGDRVVLSHQKDFPRGAEQPLNLFDGVVGLDEPITIDRFLQVARPDEFTEIGTGTLPIQSIIDALGDLPNFRCMLLEQDHTTLPVLESAETSLRAFSQFHGTTLV